MNWRILNLQPLLCWTLTILSFMKVRSSSIGRRQTKLEALWFSSHMASKSGLLVLTEFFVWTSLQFILSSTNISTGSLFPTIASILNMQNENLNALSGRKRSEISLWIATSPRSSAPSLMLVSRSMFGSFGSISFSMRPETSSVQALSVCWQWQLHLTPFTFGVAISGKSVWKSF